MPWEAWSSARFWRIPRGAEPNLTSRGLVAWASVLGDLTSQFTNRRDAWATRLRIGWLGGGGFVLSLIRPGWPAIIHVSADGPGSHVQDHYQEPHNIGGRGNDHKQQHQAYQGLEGVTSEDLHLLETGVFDIAHHQKGKHINHGQDVDVFSREPLPDFMIEGHRGGNEHGGRRDRQAVEV